MLQKGSKESTQLIHLAKESVDRVDSFFKQNHNAHNNIDVQVKAIFLIE